MSLDRLRLERPLPIDGARPRGASPHPGGTRDFQADLARAAGPEARADRIDRRDAERAAQASRSDQGGRLQHRARMEPSIAESRRDRPPVTDARQGAPPASDINAERTHVADRRRHATREDVVEAPRERDAPRPVQDSTTSVPPITTSAQRDADPTTLEAAPREEASTLPGALLALLGGEPVPAAPAPDAAPALTGGTGVLPAFAVRPPGPMGEALPVEPLPVMAAPLAGSASPAPGLHATAPGADAPLATLATVFAAPVTADATARAGVAADAFAALLPGRESNDEATSTGSLDSLTTTEGSGVVALAGRLTETLATSRAVAVLPTIAMPAVPDDGFDDGFGDRIVWMAEQRLGHAELRVSPDGVGAIDIRLQIDGQRVSAHFSAANPDVRQALESGMDRLRDLLGQHGMELARSEVGGQRQRDGRAPGAPTDRTGDGQDTAEAPVTTVRALRARGLLDEYA